ncbi:MAG: radical SAM protein, partial [Candidatus Nitrosotenuis sp.]
PKIKSDLVKSFENKKVFKFLHVPVQSGSDLVLHEMKRGHTAQTFREIVNRFRERFPKFTVSTDVIVGFPGETEEDFEKTVALLNDTRPDVVNLSRYSQRPGTPAAKLVQIPPTQVKTRSKKLFGIISQIAMENNKKWIGWTGTVLFDEQTDEMVRGRNFAYKPIFVKEPVRVGDMCNVTIEHVTNHGLYGTITS